MSQKPEQVQVRVLPCLLVGIAGKCCDLVATARSIACAGIVYSSVTAWLWMNRPHPHPDKSNGMWDVGSLEVNLEVYDCFAVHSC